MTDRSAIFDKYDSVIDSLMMDLTMIVDDSDSAIGLPMTDRSAIFDKYDSVIDSLMMDLTMIVDDSDSAIGLPMTDRFRDR